MGGKCHRFEANAFLQTAVAAQRDDVIIEDLPLCRIEFGRGTLARQRVTDGVADALSERAGGGFNAGRVAEFGMSGRFGVQVAEIGDFFDAQIVTGEMQPRIKEHRAVTGAENEAVAVEPTRIGGVDLQDGAEQRGTDFGAAQRQTEMAGVRLVDGIHSETARLIGGSGEKFIIHNGWKMRANSGQCPR